MERLTTIRLYGALGAKFGRIHKMAVQTSAEAVKALCVNLDGFESYLMGARKQGMVFSVFRGKQNVGLDDYKTLSGQSDIRIAPVMVGSKAAGIFQTILGAVLVVAGVLISVYSAGTMASFGASLAAGGVAMMAGGVYQMLSPQAKGLQSSQDPDNKPSYAFGSAVNTTAMGNPVQLPYGLYEVGGAIISAGILAEDV